MERTLHAEQAIMKAFHLALLVAAGSLVACSTPSDDAPHVETVRSSLARDTAPVLTPAELDTLKTDEAGFAVDLYRAVASSPDNAGKNVFLSPHSVSLALAMTYAGARADTKNEMKGALHFSLADDRLNSAFDYLDLALQSRGQNAQGKDGKPFRLTVANSVWGQKGAAFEAPFLDTLAVSYGAGVNVVDFAKDTEDARLAINGWVSDKTETRIPELLSQGSVDPATRLILVNAVYFNAAWATKFTQGATAPAAFTKLDASVAQVPTMHAEVSTGYVKDPAFEAVELPYDGGDTSMLVIAPTAGTFTSFESSLTGAKVLDVMAGLQPHSVQLSFPKAKLTGAYELNEPLESLGMKTAFSDLADFSGISAAETLKVSAVIHQTFLDVDEDGTEAAAATAVSFEDTAAAIPETPVVMNVDRPYLLAIVDRQTKTLVFVGRILDPS
jgi:serpin B